MVATTRVNVFLLSADSCDLCEIRLFGAGSDQQSHSTVKKCLISARIKILSFFMHPLLLHSRKIAGCCWWRIATGVDEPLVKRVSVQGQVGTSSVWHCSETRHRNLQGCSKITTGTSMCYWHPTTIAGMLLSVQKVSAMPKQGFSSPAFLPVAINTINGWFGSLFLGIFCS